MKNGTRRSIVILALLSLGGCGVQQAFDGPSVTDGVHLQLLPTGTFTVKPPPPPKPTAPRPPPPPPTSTVPAPPPPITPPTDPAFFVQALGRMCMDFGSGAVGNEATFQLCNQSLSQQVGVREVTQGGVYVFHDVTFHVNGYCVGSRGGVAAGAVLELETCNGSANQEFALDGDSIIAGEFPQIESAPAPPPGLITGLNGSADPPIARQFVVAPQGNLTSAGTPFVLETRQLTESEYLLLTATDGSGRSPHTGFRFPATGPALVTDLQQAGWGEVIVLADSATPYDLTLTLGPTGDSGATNPVSIPSGVTLRGNRKWIDNGPQLTYNSNDTGAVIIIAANDVRVTGLRFQGPTSSTGAAVTLQGIIVTDGYRVTIDHNEISQFTQAAVEVDGGMGSLPPDSCPQPDSSTGVPPWPRATPVVVARNFVHHNEAEGEGYALNSSNGAFPLFEGNVGYLNRHTVTGDDNALTGYIAQDNFVLSETPSYGLDGHDHEQDFDQHGSLMLFTPDDGITYQDHTGGYAGDYDIIEYNTVLGNNRHNFYLRGQQCRPYGLMDQNVFVEGAWATENAALDILDITGNSTQNPVNFFVTPNNAFSVADPTGDLAVGDFDGDGIDDVFVGTGIAWYYSSGAQGEWRLLQSQVTEHASDLRFADLDGDGRTDVLGVHNLGELDVSWGGVAHWQVLTTTPAAEPITSFGTGSFDTLPGDDVFMTDGSSWYIASAGQSFTYVGGSSHTDLLFGDFNGDGLTDVLTMDGGQLSYSSAARGTWTPLGGPPFTTMDGLFVGDFDGNGTTDVGWQGADTVDDSFDVELSLNTGPIQLAQTVPPPGIIVTGRFDATVPAGDAGDTVKPSVLVWWGDDTLHFVAAHGAAPGATLSRQDMR
jgi:hypothetical protein